MTDSPTSSSARVYYVVEMTVRYTSLPQAMEQAPEALAEHRARARRMHDAGQVIMAGAFLHPDSEGGPLRTMAICSTREVAEDFVAGDPFVIRGEVATHSIREWANMFSG